MPRTAGALLLFLFGFTLLGCGRSLPRPNLVLILVDTLRADHLHAYGYRRETSPVLDDLAAQGALFEQAVTAAPWTLPSAMSILTGRLPSSHRVENDGMKVSGSVPLLAEVLRSAGYRTGAVVSHVYVSPIYGFDRGFEYFDDFGLSRDHQFEAGMEPRAASVTERALDQLARLSPGPFFLLVHYFDPHWDYDPPPPFDTAFGGPYQGAITGSYQSFSEFTNPALELPEADRQHLLDLYDGEVAYTDSQVGRLVEELSRRGLADKTVLMVTSDHGEEFKEHGSMGHGRNLYDEVLRIPLVLSDPRRTRGSLRISKQVSTIDIFPTLCELGQAPLPGRIEGRSLLSLLEDEEGGEEGAISETIRFDAYRKSYRTPHEKLIVSLENNQRELYDLDLDPKEQKNLWWEQKERAALMEESLFARVDLLSGGWNLRWSSDGRPHRFSGRLETEGIFTELIPLFPQAQRHRVTMGKRVDFDLEGVTGGGGLAFRVEPPEARIGFSLAVDGEERPEWIRVGGTRSRPPSVPFGYGGEVRGDVKIRPAFRTGEEIGFFLWKNPSVEPQERVELDETLRERLRSLGYIQ